MDGYEVRIHVNSILAALGEILAEVRGLREELQSGQAVAMDDVEIDFVYMLDNMKGVTE